MNRSLRCLTAAAAVALFLLMSLTASAQETLSHAAVRDYAGELACGAQALGRPPDTSIRIAAGREHGKALFGPDDSLVVKASSTQGLKVGQEYFVRRIVADRFVPPGTDGTTTSSIHTAGWIRIVDVQGESAIATVTRICDAIQEGDYLEPFVKPQVPAAATTGEPDFANPGHLVLGDERRQMAAQGDLMVLDRGSDHGLRGGQRLTIFRMTGDGTGPIARIGEATAVVVNPETTVIRIDKTSDAVVVGDLVAIHR